MTVQLLSGGNFASIGMLDSAEFRAPLPTTNIAIGTPGESSDYAGLHVPNIDIVVEALAADTIIVGSALRFSTNVATIDFAGETVKFAVARPNTTGFSAAVALEASTTTAQTITARIQGKVSVDAAGTISTGAALAVNATAGHVTTAATGEPVYGFALTGGTDTLITAVIFPFPVFVAQ